MIPRAEIDTLVMTVTDALDLAAEGKVADGYTALLAGVERARELGDEPWGPELISRWAIALDRYTEQFGVPMGGN